MIQNNHVNTREKSRTTYEINIQNSNKMKSLIDLFTYQPINFNNYFLAHLWERARVRVTTHVNIPPTKVKPAFTLAEVLITLGIIGIVAALTIPTLITNYKAKKLRTQFLKSFSIIQQAVKLMQNDDVSLDPTMYNGRKFPFYKVFINYLQAPLDCGDSSVVGGRLAPCYGRTKGKPYISFDGKNEISGVYLDDGQIALQDGSLILFENYYNSGIIWISVDLNGYNNPPNRWGYDLFTFQLIDEEIKTMGDTGTQYTDIDKYCNPKVSNNLNGIACAKKAKDDTDYFKKVVKEFK